MLHGSRVAGTHRPDSDLDVAAWWAGRIALHGVMLHDDDPPARVRWVATTRKIYSDEQPRMLRSHRDTESVRRGR